MVPWCHSGAMTFHAFKVLVSAGTLKLWWSWLADIVGVDRKETVEGIGTASTCKPWTAELTEFTHFVASSALRHAHPI